MRLMASLQPSGLLAFRLSLPLVGLSVLVKKMGTPTPHHKSPNTSQERQG